MDKIIKIAVLKSGAIGDLIMITPALKSLRSVYPDAEITLLCADEYGYVLKDNPHITSVSTFSLNTIFNGTIYEKYAETVRIVNLLRGFDAAYTLNTDKRWHLLSFLAGIPFRFACGYSKSYFASYTYICKPDEHRAETWVNTVMLKATQGNASRSYEFFPEPFCLSLPDKPYIAIAPGGGNNVKAKYPQKIWDKFGELTDMIMSETEFDIALLGNAEDRIDFAPSERIKDYRGMTTLSDCCHIIAGAVRFVGNDSGLMHLAACTDTPVTAIYGATNFLHTRPYNNPDNAVVSSSLSCSPCEKRGRFGCDVNQCMQMISCEEVFLTVAF